jgi:type IV pilus assembly protein PilQ
MKIFIFYTGMAAWLMIFGLSVFLFGCVSKDEKKITAGEEIKIWQAKAAKSEPVSPAPPEDIHDDYSVLEDMSDSRAIIHKESDKKTEFFNVRKLPVIPISLKMHGVDLPVLIQTLARVAGLNIVINESVQGKAKLVITDVPWDQAFVGILDTFGLTYEWSGDILRVVSVDDLKKKQAMMEAKQNYEKSKNDHALKLMQLANKKKQLQPLVTKIVKIQYADIHSLQQNLMQYLLIKKQETVEKKTESLMAKKPEQVQKTDLQGSIMVDTFSNSLILHVARADINKIMPIIKKLDQPVRQVLIEAHIVEAESNTGKELGIQWGGLGTATSSNEKSVSIGGNIKEFGTTFPQQLDDDGNLIAHQPYWPSDGNIVNLPIAASTGMALGIMAQKVGEYVLYAQLLALEQQGMLNILSKPSITTLNHRKAIIKSGKEVPFQTVVNDEVNIEWKEAVVKLDVTPHIINKDIIKLEIVTHKDELDFTNAQDMGGNPTIITKNAETTVTLFDGQTTVIGGLNKEKNSGAEQGVPGLKDIPGLGWLFKNINNTKEMEELLIFITPHILKTKQNSPGKKQH